MTKDKKEEYLIISLLPLVILIYSVISLPKADLIMNLRNIFMSNDVLLSDYFIVAGRETAMLNASLVALINIYIIYRLDMKINGLNIAGVFLMLGFAFMGKNLLNIIPFYIGGYLYALYSQKTFKSVIVVIMFSTALSPFLSATANFFNFSIAGFILAVITGIILGFIMPAVSGHVIQFHSGYSLYNTGLAAGLIAIVFFSVLKAANLNIEPNKIFSRTLDLDILALLCGVFLFYIAYGFIKNGRSFNGFGNLLKHSGRLVSDFTVTEGFPIVVMNMGVLGFLCLVFVLLFFPMINGPVLAGMFTVIGFAGFGKHVKNVFPVMVGIVAGYYAFDRNMSEAAFAVTLYFSTTLAPISGKYGAFYGLLAGFLNYCLVSNIGPAHGGLNLYNTGLAGGIVSSVLVPIIGIFKEREVD